MAVVRHSTTDPGLPDLNGVGVGGSDVDKVGVGDDKVGVRAGPEGARCAALAGDDGTIRRTRQARSRG